MGVEVDLRVRERVVEEKGSEDDFIMRENPLFILLNIYIYGQCKWPTFTLHMA